MRDRLSALVSGANVPRGRLVLGTALLAFAMACEQAAPPAPPAPLVTVVQPRRQEVRLSAEFTGVTRAVESVEVRARVSGELQSVDFQPSSKVEKGALLFVIEREKYKAARDQAEASVKSAEADLAQANSDLQRIELAIQTNAVSKQDLDRAQAVQKRAEATLLSARAALVDAELEYSYTMVRSPIAGLVSRNYVDAGNLVGRSEQTLLTTVNRTVPIYVYFEAPESAVLEFKKEERRLREKMGEDKSFTNDHAGKTLIMTANEESFSHEGHIDYIDNTVNPRTGTIQLRAVIPNEDAFLFPGLFVRVRVLGALIPDALVVDERAIGTDLGGKYVLVVGEENIVEQRYVILGAKQDNGTFVVKEGLDGSERYVVNGMLRARPGLPVTPMTPEEAEQAARAAQAGGGAKP